MKKLFLFIIPFFFYQCEKEAIVENTLKRTSTKNEIPFETKESLAQSGATSLEKDADIVHYKVMRNFAIQEIQKNFTEDLNIKGDYSLSEFPVIIYNYDSKPAYYEFIVYQNENPTSTITTFANKNTDDLIAYILPYVRDYSRYSANTDFFVGLYPNNPYIGDASNFGQRPSNLLDSESKPVKPLAVSDIDKLENLYAMLPSEDQAEIGGGKEQIKAEILTEIEEGKTFWNKTHSEFEELIATPDREIKANSFTGKTNTVLYTTPHNFNWRLRLTHWHTACGPSVLAWIYRGLFYRYNSTYIKVHGDRVVPGVFENEQITTPNRVINFSVWREGNPNSLSDLNAHVSGVDGGLLHDIYDEGNTVWGGMLNGMTWPTGMQRAFKRVTNHQYRLPYITNIHLHIKNHRLPAIRMIATGGGTLHYICEFTTKKVNGKKYFLVTDNGSTMDDHNSVPYWRNKTAAAWGFRYGVRIN